MSNALRWLLGLGFVVIWMLPISGCEAPIDIQSQELQAAHDASANGKPTEDETVGSPWNGPVQVLSANSSAISATAALVIALSAVTTVWLTWNLMMENRLLRKASTEPEVVAYLTIDPNSRHMIYLALANVGQGPARNVRFSLMGESGADDERLAFALRRRLQSAAERTATTTLLQGDSIHSLFGFAPELLRNPPLPAMTISVKFEDLKGISKETNNLVDASDLDWIGWAERTITE